MQGHDMIMTDAAGDVAFHAAVDCFWSGRPFVRRASGPECRGGGVYLSQRQIQLAPGCLDVVSKQSRAFVRHENHYTVDTVTRAGSSYYLERKYEAAEHHVLLLPDSSFHSEE